MISHGRGKPGCLDSRPIERLRNHITWLEKRLKAKEGEVRNIQHELKAFRSLLEKAYTLRARAADAVDASDSGRNVL